MSVRDLIPWGRDKQVPGPRPQDPFLALHREVNRLFDDVWRDGFSNVGLFGGRTTWPTLDVMENDKEIRVEAELPGMTEKDVDVLLVENWLTLKGEKKAESKDDDDGVRLNERYYGAFERTIALDSEIDRDKVEASFKDGILTVVLPKTANAKQKSKRIPVLKQ